MEYTGLGRTGVRVSRLSLGVYSVTGMYGRVARDRALRVILEAVSLGITTMDTADVYGRGLGEELVAEAEKTAGRRLTIITKVGYDFYNNDRPVPRHEPDYLLWALERSVERLDRPPEVVLVHNPSLSSLRDPSLYRAMERMVEEGLASHAGVALGPETDVLPHALEALRHEEVEVIEFVLNPLELEPGATIARLAGERGVGTIVRVPHAGGVLDETVREPKPPGDHRRLRRPGWYEWALRAYRLLKERVYSMLPGHPARATLALILALAPVDTIALTAPSITHLHLYVGPEAFQRIPEDLVEEARRIYWEMIAESPEAPRGSLRLLSDGEGGVGAPGVHG